MSCCVARRNGGSASGGRVPVNNVTDEILVDIDFSTLANNTFADGNEVIDGVTWVAANTANSNTWDILNGTGLRFNAAAVNTVYDATTRSASNLSVPILSLIPSFDPLRTYVIDTFLSSVTFAVSGNRFVSGMLLNTAGTDRLYAGGRRNSAGNQQTYGQLDGTINGDGNYADDAFGVRLVTSGVSTYSGTMGADFPDPYPRGGGVFTLAASFNGPFDPTQGAFVLAWPTGEAGGNMDCVLERLRIRRIAG